MLFLLSACATGSSSDENGKYYFGPEANERDVVAIEKIVEKMGPVGKDLSMSIADKQALIKKTFDILVNKGEAICGELSIKPEGCGWMKFFIQEYAKINAYAWGKSAISVHKGLLDYAENEHEMAYILSHEMGHLLADHISENADTSSQRGGFKLRTLVCGLSCTSVLPSSGEFERAAIMTEMGKNSFNRQQEREADYIAVYLMKTSGFDLVKGKQFLFKMASLQPKSGEKGKYGAEYFDTHAFSVARLIRLKLAGKEFDQKQLAGKSLLPTGTIGVPSSSGLENKKNYY